MLPFYLAEIRDTDYRTKTFSCCRCGTDGALAPADIAAHEQRPMGLAQRTEAVRNARERANHARG
jgi:hypothetical protein